MYTIKFLKMLSYTNTD